MTAKELAIKIENDTEWRAKDLLELAQAVGTEKEWLLANMDDFETVIDVMIEKAMEGEEE